MTAPITTIRLYMVYDTVAQKTTGGIIQCGNDEVARRSFHDALTDTNSPFLKHAPDYDLIYIGTLRENDGAILMAEADVIARGADIVAANSKPEIVK